MLEAISKTCTVERRCGSPIILILPILSMKRAEMMLPGNTAKLPRKLTM